MLIRKTTARISAEIFNQLTWFHSSAFKSWSNSNAQFFLYKEKCKSHQWKKWCFQGFETGLEENPNLRSTKIISLSWSYCWILNCSKSFFFSFFEVLFWVQHAVKIYRLPHTNRYLEQDYLHNRRTFSQETFDRWMQRSKFSALLIEELCAVHRKFPLCG